jgi:PPK2 family polyphosphate:nucleotide phosphotransferase
VDQTRLARWRVPFDGAFALADTSTEPMPDVPGGKVPGKRKLRKARAAQTERLRDLQQRLYAERRHSVLLVFQAMDAAGKDGTIRAVLSGVNPAGCVVHPFGPPSKEDLSHDFLWRTTRRLPAKGHIGVFNRSYYEEVLVVRVQPEYLEAQRLPRGVPLDQLWQQRFDSIRAHERHLAENGTTVIKFFLNVSRDEQCRRLLRRIDDPERNWKFNAGDLKVRARWDEYMAAYQAALQETSRPWAPWYCIPADNKDFMRLQVANIVVQTIEALNSQFPELPADDHARLHEFRAELTQGKPS